MPLYNRTTLQTLEDGVKAGEVQPVYLFCGDRFLCRQAADRLCSILCRDDGAVHVIDGDNEDVQATMAKLRSFSLFPGRQIFRVNNTKLFHSKKIAKSLWNRAIKAQADEKPDRAALSLRAMMDAGGLDSADPENNLAEFSATQWKKCFSFVKPSGDLHWISKILARSTTDKTPGSSTPVADTAQLLQETLQAGIPTDNILMLLAEEVDKRKKLYKYIKKSFVIVDLSVDTGSSFQARKKQTAVLIEQANQILRGLGKSMSPQVMEQLLERVGFYPVAVTIEIEKLALYVGNRSNITLEDLNTMVGRTRQDALFELTQAIGEQHIDAALVVLSRLLENGNHGLAILATLRNFTRKLLLFRALAGQERYGIRPNMPANLFQSKCLPLLKENQSWQKELSAHPYAVYMQFKTAASFSLAQLRSWLEIILEADMKLKGSPLATETVLQHVILTMTSKKVKGNLQNRHEALQ